jgi:hypothetical protein
VTQQRGSDGRDLCLLRYHQTLGGSAQARDLGNKLQLRCRLEILPDIFQIDRIAVTVITGWKVQLLTFAAPGSPIAEAA